MVWKILLKSKHSKEFLFWSILRNATFQSNSEQQATSKKSTKEDDFVDLTSSQEEEKNEYEITKQEEALER